MRSRAAAKRIALAAATAFIAVNIWTGVPLLALWIGSRAVGQTTLSMGAVIIVVGVLIVMDLTMGALLVRLNHVYQRLVGAPEGRLRAAWLRSLAGEGDEETAGHLGVTLIERIVVICVYAAMGAFLVWFVFFAGSPLPG
ncbi:MAG TPA: hypothetical protein VMB05_10905 [Solirubrobacteraceae bacterium]|nr:hypothetical protein [Solirubrobacteraceae bacterium]